MQGLYSVTMGLTSAKRAGERMAGIGALLLDVAFPPRCPACHEEVSAQHNFCAPCFDALRQIAAPLCDCCGIPFAFDVGAGAQCPECLADPPSFDSVRAPLVYDTTSAPLIRSLKFHDRYTGIARATAMMVAALGERRADVIVPVPLHWRRLCMRRFNQAALLAHALARATSMPVAAQGLKRVRYTTPQMRLPRAERLKNVRNAFAVPEGALVEEKIILLVDDVVTTGATVAACAAALKKAGAAEVHVLALARTVKE